MPGRALSNSKKAQNAQEAYEDLKTHAIEVYKNECKKLNRKGACTIAQDFMDLYRKETRKSVRLCYNTLIRGADGGRSCAEKNAAKSWLTTEETTHIITYITELGN